MGKKSKLKASRKAANFSVQDWANFYLNANDKEAGQLRLKLADFFLDKATASMTPEGQPIPLLDVLSTLPGSFVFPYVSLVGHSLIGSRHKDFWPNIATNLLAITTGIENEKALKSWGNLTGEVALFNSIVAREWCYSVLQKLGERCDPIKIYSMGAEVLQTGINGFYCDAIPTHLVVSSCVAKKQIIHQSGSLILCYAGGYKGNEDKELWLVKKRHDGIYTTSSEARDGTLKASDVRDMRHFVQNYQGLQMKGRLCPAREQQAARICRFVGLHVDGNYAYLKSPCKLAL
jgi:hypothetical protein